MALDPPPAPGPAPGPPPVVVVLSHAVVLGLAGVFTYWVVGDVLVHVHSVSKISDLVGGMWAVISALFVCRTSYVQTLTFALSRLVATTFGFALSFIYLLLLPFHLWGLGLLIGLGIALPMLTRRPDDAITTAITVTVLLVLAAVTPHDAWEQPILRLVDTAVGVAIGIVASRIDLWTSDRLARWVKGGAAHPARPG
jgi:uncharacterized membrane protein YccC